MTVRSRTIRGSSCTSLVKGMKTDTMISSGFRTVFPKLTKKSWFRWTSRLPPGGFRDDCSLNLNTSDMNLPQILNLTWLTVGDDAHFAVPGSQNRVQVWVWVRAHDVSSKRLKMQNKSNEWIHMILVLGFLLDSCGSMDCYSRAEINQ